MMTPDLRLLAYSALLTWVMILVASTLRAKGAVMVAFGNREAMPEPSPLAGRADRAAKNMLENMILFTAVVVAAHGAADHDRVVLGARVFFWARVVYWPLYLSGVKYARTAAWATGVGGCALMLIAAL